MAVLRTREAAGSVKLVAKAKDAMIHQDILGTIGNTLAPSHVTMYVKCEAFDPMSSVKDRSG
jgi:cysteine synthase